MPWDEAIRLTKILINDPTAQVAAAMSEWDHTIDRTTLAVLDLFDLQHQIAWTQGGKKGQSPKPHPGRPFKRQQPDTTRRLGNTEGRSRADVVEYLNSLGHHLPVEDA